MRYQDAIIENTKAAAEQAFKYAKKVPADKLDWKPLGEGRSVLDICREMACCAEWSERILRNEPFPEFTPEIQEAIAKQNESMKTAEDCEAECNRRLDTYLKAVAEFPDDKLGDTFTLPFDGGQTITMKQNMDYPRWNFEYHQGQIAYIQTLYGDKQVYW